MLYTEDTSEKEILALIYYILYHKHFWIIIFIHAENVFKLQINKVIKCKFTVAEI